MGTPVAGHADLSDGQGDYAPVRGVGPAEKTRTGNRTKSDTGRRAEYAQALERTLVKELCKLAP